MAEDVIDIRKRIEEIRNEVSSAITTGDETVTFAARRGHCGVFCARREQLCSSCQTCGT